jgi:hypothetical protein
MLWNASSRYTLSALKPAILDEADEAPNRRLRADSARASRDSVVSRDSAGKRDSILKRDSVAKPVSAPARP